MNRKKASYSMRYIVFLILIGFAVILSTNVYAMPGFHSQEIYDFSNVIVLGKVISVDSTFSPTHNLYEIKVEKFLKNQQDSDVLFAAGQKTVNIRLGNQVFDVNDRGLFYLTNNTLGYDPYSGIFGISSNSQLVEPQWEKCNIFEKEITREHWFLGGVGIAPKIQQGINSDIENFKKDKMVTVIYDVSNLSDFVQEFDLDGTILISNGTTLEVMATMNQHIILEPCTIYKTIDWRFTPNMTGFYNFEIEDPRSGSYGLGFTVVDNDLVESPRKQFKSGITIDHIQCKEGFVVVIKKSNGNPNCVKHETLEKLRERGWAEPLGDIVFQRPSQSKSESDDTLSESDYDPHSPRCGSGVVPYIPENWQTTGMHPSGETWETLNRHLMVQFFFKELQNRNIVFDPACFGVYTGIVEQSYPPRFSMCSMVTASNGTNIYLEGTIREFDVTYFDIDNEIPYQCDDNQGSCLCGIENEN